MATTSTYNIQVNATQANQALDTLNRKVQGANDVFGKLKGVIGGLAIGAAVSGLLRFADQIQDLNDATGIATANLLGFQKAVQDFGGSAEAGGKAVLKLVANIGEAAAGSAPLQDAFSRVGVSLNDLATLSEQDILKKTIEGLGKITDQSEQAILKQQLLGKEFRGIATSGLAEAYAKSTEESRKYADSIKAAADTSQQLETALHKIKLAALETLKPLADVINSMDTAQLGEILESFVKIGAAAAAIYAAVKALEAMRSVIIAIAQGVGGIIAFVASLTLVGKIAAGIVAVLIVLAAVFKSLTGIDPITKLADGFGKLFDKAKDFLGLQQEIAKVKPPSIGLNTGSGPRTPGLGPQAIAGPGVDTAESVKKIREVTDAFNKQRETIRGASDAFANSNKNIFDQIDLNNRLIGTTTLQSETVKAQEEIMKRAGQEIDKLRDAKAKLSAEEQRAGLGAEYDKQIAKIEELAKADAARIASSIQGNQKLLQIESLRKFGIQNEIDMQSKLQAIQDDMAKSTMSEIEKKYYDIDAAAKASAKSAIDAEAARIGRPLNTQEQKAYYDAALKGTMALKRAQGDLYSSSRSFATGWKQAFNEYVDNATNAANQAKNFFNKAVSGMEDMLVNFVKTGKLSWKSFLADMLEQLLRSQIQQTFAKIFTSPQGGGIMDAIGSLFGAGGGAAAPGTTPNNPMYVIDLAGGGAGMARGGVGGGGGGGLWDSVKGVFGGIADSVSGVFGSIADTVGGLFGGDGGGGILSSIGDFFGGFFAKGGNLGAGKWGIAGENGPEIISGPASITPMGGSTNVTYNINAVDAQSFKAMIAADPSFIYAVSQQGAKGIPARR